MIQINNLGNPLAEALEITGYIAAFLPNLVYYEFKMVDVKLRKEYTDKNQGEIFKVIDFNFMHNMFSFF